MTEEKKTVQAEKKTVQETLNKKKEKKLLVPGLCNLPFCNAQVTRGNYSATFNKY